MMKIEHIAIWVNNLELMRDFYVKYFNAKSNERYHNPKKNFSSYFLSFDQGCRLELMHKPEIPENKNNPIQENIGIIHFAIELGSKKKVNELTERFRQDGYTIIGEPRVTGDGYYESVILDPEENRIELCA